MKNSTLVTRQYRGTPIWDEVPHMGKRYLTGGMAYQIGDGVPDKGAIPDREDEVPDRRCGAKKGMEYQIGAGVLDRGWGYQIVPPAPSDSCFPSGPPLPPIWSLLPSGTILLASTSDPTPWLPKVPPPTLAGIGYSPIFISNVCFNLSSRGFNLTLCAPLHVKNNIIHLTWKNSQNSGEVTSFPSIGTLRVTKHILKQQASK